MWHIWCNSLSLWFSLKPLSSSHSHTQSLSFFKENITMHPLAHTHTLSHTLAPTRTHSHTFTHTRTHSHTLTHMPSVPTKNRNRRPHVCLRRASVYGVAELKTPAGETDQSAAFSAERRPIRIERARRQRTRAKFLFFALESSKRPHRRSTLSSALKKKEALDLFSPSSSSFLNKIIAQSFLE